MSEQDFSQRITEFLAKVKVALDLFLPRVSHGQLAAAVASWLPKAHSKSPATALRPFIRDAGFRMRKLTGLLPQPSDLQLQPLEPIPHNPDFSSLCAAIHDRLPTQQTAVPQRVYFGSLLIGYQHRATRPPSRSPSTDSVSHSQPTPLSPDSHQLSTLGIRPSPPGAFQDPSALRSFLPQYTDALTAEDELTLEQAQTLFGWHRYASIVIRILRDPGYSADQCFARFNPWPEPSFSVAIFDAPRPTHVYPISYYSLGQLRAIDALNREKNCPYIYV